MTALITNTITSAWRWHFAISFEPSSCLPIKGLGLNHQSTLQSYESCFSVIHCCKLLLMLFNRGVCLCVKLVLLFSKGVIKWEDRGIRSKKTRSAANDDSIRLLILPAFLFFIIAAVTASKMPASNGHRWGPRTLATRNIKVITMLQIEIYYDDVSFATVEIIILTLNCEISADRWDSIELWLFSTKRESSSSRKDHQSIEDCVITGEGRRTSPTIRPVVKSNKRQQGRQNTPNTTQVKQY